MNINNGGEKSLELLLDKYKENVTGLDQIAAIGNRVVRIWTNVIIYFLIKHVRVIHMVREI